MIALGVSRERPCSWGVPARTPTGFSLPCRHRLIVQTFQLCGLNV